MTLSEVSSGMVVMLPAAARIGAVLMTGPLLAHRCIPWSVRLVIGVGLTAAITPLASASPAATPDHPLGLMLGVFVEGLIGSLMGLSLWIMIWAIRLAGEVIESLSGMGMAGLLDPQAGQTGGDGPVTRLYWWTMLGVFVAAGGIGQMIAGVLNSFVTLPAGSAVFDALFLDFLVAAIGSSFELGLQVAIPAMLALFAAAIVLSMVQRNFPQLGGLQIGLGLKTILGMALTSIILLTAPWVIFGGLQVTLEQFHQFIQLVPGKA